mgnify:FL=1|tara:strand:+ start:4678 stop:5529 length:852 start_codon:yes stop_codon:yes gene_type:complete
MKSKWRLIVGAAVVAVSLVGYCANAQRYRLAWSDEFDYKGLPDSTKWIYDVGDGCPVFCGWGGNEEQYYTYKRTNNARVESGYLVIEAHREKFGDADYTSARVVTRGKNEWLYGKIEVRARLPAGSGTSPAIWMLPYFDDRPVKLPEDGQLDIMVHSGAEVDVIHGMVHTSAYNLSLGTERMGHIQLSAVDKRFHTFSIEWTPTKIEWFVDGKKYHKAVDDGTGKDGWPFFNPFYLILNVSVRQGQGLESTDWPQRMEVDFVRVYQRKPRKRPQDDEFMDEGF